MGNLANGLGVEAASPIQARGFFTAVDDDSSGDFTATALVNRDRAPSLLLIIDRLGGFTLTPTVTTSGLTLALTGDAGPFEVATIDRGFVGATALPTDPAPTLAPTEAGLGFFLLRDKTTGAASLHLRFADFLTDLDARLVGGASLFRISSTGIYDAGANSLAAGLATAVLR